MSNKQQPKIVVKVTQIVKGIIHIIEDAFEDIEHALAHAKQNEGHSYKIYDKHGNLEHQGACTSKHHHKKHHHDQDDDTYA